MPKNADERYILDIAKRIPGAEARPATPEEDCGNKKADVIVKYGSKDYYFQVSHTPKSGGEHERLERLGTHPIATHKYDDKKTVIPFSDKELYDMILRTINAR
jgi:hypothetical protein